MELATREHMIFSGSALLDRKSTGKPALQENPVPSRWSV